MASAGVLWQERCRQSKEKAAEALFMPQMKRMSRVAAAWQVETR